MRDHYQGHQETLPQDHGEDQNEAVRETRQQVRPGTRREHIHGTQRQENRTVNQEDDARGHNQAAQREETARVRGTDRLGCQTRSS